MKERRIKAVDKKDTNVSFNQWLEELKHRQDFEHKIDPTQKEATVYVYGEYPHIPIGISFLTDVHFGNYGVDYHSLDKHLTIIKETPNMFMFMGGDMIDAFSPTKHPTGMMNDIMPPDEQADIMLGVLEDFDQQSKLVGVLLGNHDHFINEAGYRFEKFLSRIKAPVYQGAGNLNILVGEGGEKYRIFVSHTHWGSSKINITNAAKRALQFTSPDADMAFLGHTHQASCEIYHIGGKHKIALVGGTYKVDDKWLQKWGSLEKPLGGFTVFFYPDKHHMEVVRYPDIARDVILSMIKYDNRPDPYTELIKKLKKSK
ncbi:MAG: hypothetical protein KatS3mg101_1068 [Patescibacteria group bacterium]|nr:MAG: hypothetical protein KatS3mg101_1068 [Patescibacteria group bacterium]